MLKLRDTNPGSILSAEAQLLCLCARTTIDADCADAISQTVAAGINWEDFLNLAQRHKLLPMVCAALCRTARVTMPQSAHVFLTEKYARNIRLNLGLLAELKRLLCALEARGVVAVPFKGLALAAVYGSLALREAGDIDLLIQRADVAAVGDALRQLGYQPDEPRDPTAEHAKAASKYCYHLGFSHPQNGTIVEPHWAIMPRFYSPALDDWTSGLWRRLGKQDIFGAPAAALAPHDLPLLLAIHAGRHLWGQMNWICDLAELIRAQPNLDWSQMLASADSIGQGRVLRLGLVLAADILGAAVPPAILHSAKSDGRVNKLSARVKRWLFAHSNASAAGDISRTRFIMQSMDWQRDRASWVWHHLVARF